jgi:hypothetical protein
MKRATAASPRQRTQQGNYMVLMAILLAVLIGFGALAIDLGRVFVLRSEMQNAADAAAIAAAAELRGDSGAQSRAAAAARNMLQHDSKFAEVHDLLGVNIGLEYFCAIRSRYDPTDAEVDEFCSNAYDANGYSAASNDAESHYVRVTLAAGDGEGEPYSVRLFFLPALGALTGGVNPRTSLTATATGGRNFYMCAFPPVMLCNPFESTGTSFSEGMTPGQQIILKQQGSNHWAPGNASFIRPDNILGGGAPEIAKYLADADSIGCRPPLLTTATGAMTNQASNAVNTRFGIYAAPGFNKPADKTSYLPAPNVMKFTADFHDQGWNPDDARFGNGVWNRDKYFNDNHAIRPAGWDLMTRWEVYNWELDNDAVPAAGIPLNSPGDRDRRIMKVAVVDCEAHSLNGVKTFPLISPEGFAKLFLLQNVPAPPNADIHVEFVEWIGESDEDFHTDVQIYE